jgi:hypothetical protein
MENNDKTLALAPQRELTPAIWQMISEMAPVMYKSRLFGVSSQEAATGIMLKGYELGLSISASFELIQVVQGKPGLSPRGAMALLLNSPKIKKITINRLVSEKGIYQGHECFMARDNGFEYTVRFTLEDAKRAGLVKPGSGWENYPENMCQWRAVGFCADVVAPDIVAGMTNIMKMPEQYGVTLTNGGDIIDAVPTAPKSILATDPMFDDGPVITVDELLAKYEPDAIMKVLDGRLPTTPQECRIVNDKLEEIPF